MKKNSLLFCFFVFTIQMFAQDQKVSMPFSVLDQNGIFFAELKSADIQFMKNTDFSLEVKTDNRIEVVIMIDTSMSQERVLPFEKQIAEYFVEKVLRSEIDKVSIVSFTGKAYVEHFLSDDLKTAKEKIRRLKFIPPSGYLGGGIVIGTTNNTNQAVQGSTSIWESTKESVNTLYQSPSNNSRRAVIIITDGVNTSGNTKINDLVDYAVMTKIPVYSIGIADKMYGGMDKKNLKKLAEETGGFAMFPEIEKDFAKDIIKFENELRSHYLMTFSVSYSLKTDKLIEAKIEIINQTLKKQKLEIVQPKGFFFPNQK